MIKAIILDDGSHSKDVMFGKNYECVSLVDFLNSRCRSHLYDYEVKTAHFEDIESDVAAGCI